MPGRRRETYNGKPNACYNLIIGETSPGHCFFCVNASLKSPKLLREKVLPEGKKSIGQDTSNVVRKSTLEPAEFILPEESSKWKDF